MEKMQTDNNSSPITKRSRQIFMIAFATIAFFMTAYATSGGVRMFLTEPYAWIGITALCVGFLALTSLVLGDGISSKKITQVVLITPFFLIAVAICWILSFASYHQQFLSVGKSDLANSETNLRQMAIYAHDVTKAMNDQIEDQRTALIDGDVFTKYSTAMIGLADELKDRDKKKEIASKLQSMIDTKKIELINRQAKLEVNESRLRNGLERLAINIVKLEKLSLEKQAAFDDALTLFTQVELAIQQEEGDPNIPSGQRPLLERDSLARQLVNTPACDRRRSAGKGGVIPGPCFSALTDKLTETRILIDENKKARDISLQDIKDARQRQTIEQNDLKELMAQHEIDKLKSSEEFASEFTLDSNGFLQSLNAFIDQPSELTFKTTANYCQNVTEVLSDINATSELPACEPQAFTAVFKQYNSLNEEQNIVNLACEESSSRIQIIEDLRREILGLTGPERLVPITRSYDKMRTEVLEPCLIAAEQKGLATASFRGDLASLYDRINPSQDPISKAIGKVTSLFDGTASARDYFPALLALLQELSLLLTKLFWDANSAKKPATRKDDEDYSDLDLEAKSDDPIAVLAAKNLLLNTTFHKQKHLLPQTFDEEYSHQMRSHMRRITDNLFRKKLATKSARGIFISEDGMTEIARQISRHNQVVQIDSEVPAPVSKPADPVNIVETEKTSVSSVVDNDKLETQQLDAPEPIAEIEPEIKAPEAEDESDETSEQKPRKRRPIVVRPNFRREV